MKTVGIIQSNFIPWRGYFDFINEVDHFVLLDDVQYTCRDWRNRNRLPRRRGGCDWLTIPVRYTNGQKIREVLIDSEQRWAERHLEILRHRYHRAPFFTMIFGLMSEAYRQSFTHLWELNAHLIFKIAAMLGITTPITMSSQLEVEHGKNERLISITRQLGGTRYLSGPAARSYIDPDAWRRARIELAFKDYPQYPAYQQICPTFEPFVSVVDLMAMTGPEAPRYIWGD